MDDEENSDQLQQDSMEDMANSVGEKASSAAQNVESKIASSVKGKMQDAVDIAKGKKKIVGPEKKARGKLYSTEGQAQKAAGVATDAAGKAAQATGSAIHAVGTLNKGAAAGTRALGSALGAIPYVGAALKSGMEAQAQILEKAGDAAQKAGSKIKETGEKTSDLGKKQIEAGQHKINRGTKLQNEGVDIGAKSEPSSQIPSMPGIPKIGTPPSPNSIANGVKNKFNNFKTAFKTNPFVKWGIIGGIAFFALIIIFLVIVLVTVNTGKHIDGDNSNVPYVVTKMALDSIEIFPDGSGGYTYGFVDENGVAMTMDETLDKILKTLKDNQSSAYNDLGETDTQRKEFLKLLIQAEVSTQFPNLTIKTNGSVAGAPMNVATGITVQTTGKDFVVATDAENASNVLDEAGLTAAVNNSDLGEQAKQNVLSVIPDLVRLQNTYKVNALFLIAVARKESSCGTDWKAINPNTYNWLSVKKPDASGYREYSSFVEASEDWFKLISSSESYFGGGNYSVKQIATDYCGTAWGEDVCKYMEQFYGYAGASTEREVAAIQNTSVEASPSQSKSNIAEWGWLIQNQNINAYYYENALENVTYDSSNVKGYITEDRRYYIVYSNSTGWYVGQGVQIKYGDKWNEFNINLLKNHGVDTDNIQLGSTIEAKTVDIVSQEILEYLKNDMKSQATTKGLNLNENQIIALIDIEYQNGNVSTQLENIKKYGENSEELANTPGFEYVLENDTPTSRAQAVWKLYRYGKYEAISGNPYNANNFGGTPQETSTVGTTNSSGSGTSAEDNRAPNSGIAQAGGIDANGVTITSGGNIDFLNYAIDCHALVREEGFTYSQGRSLPVTRNDRLGTIDCSCYVSMALDAYGCNDWSGYPHQLTASGGTLVEYSRQKNFEFIYEGSASSINEIPDIQSGDIVLMPGHTQIFYGYTSSGESVWLNCGSTNSIQKQEGEEHGWYATPIKYVIRVPGGTGSAYSRKVLQTLTNNENSVQGNIEIKRKNESGEEVTLEYIDEASFDRMISSKNSAVLNYYTMKKGNAGNTSQTSQATQNTPGTLSGDDDEAKIWNFLIDSGLTEQGAAGLMGNMENESSFNSMCVEDDWTLGNNRMTFDTEYTQKVDNGTISESEFTTTGGIKSNHKGYGLVQWTTEDRKKGLYDYVKSKNQSIGDLQTQLEYLVIEMQASYSSVWSEITTSTSINDCSDIVLKKFEIPRDISGQMPKRREKAERIYAKYAGTRTPGATTAQTQGTTTAQTQGTNTTTSTANTTVASANTQSVAYNSSNPEMATYQGDGYDFNRFWLYTISFEDWDAYSYHMNLPDNISYEGGYNVKKKVTQDRQYYISGYDEEGNPDIGMGVSLGTSGGSVHKENIERFAAHGISQSQLAPGGKVPCEIADQVSQEEILHDYEKVKSDAAKYGVSLTEYQMQALADAYYNYGGASQTCKSFWSAYKKYGDSEQLAKNCGVFYYVPESTTAADIRNMGSHKNSRKASRWMLFKYGKYMPRHKVYYGEEYSLPGLSTGVVSFDNFLFLGDSRYELIDSELKSFGDNISVCAVSSSTAKEWLAIMDSGSGNVHGKDITLPATASNVSVMLGANSGPYQIEELKQVMQKLHERYPSAKIFFNSVYHVGSNYVLGTPDETNKLYDKVNTELSSFCSANDWAIYIDITEGIHDSNGYMVDPDSEGIHITGEGKNKLVENIKKQISGSIAVPAPMDGQNSSGDTSNNWKIVVASYDVKTVTSVDSYQYSHTRVISTNSGTTGSGSQMTSTPAGKSTSNTTVTFKPTEIDYQPALKNHTLYFDFLWATYIASSDKDLVKELAQEAIDSKVQITVYTDLQTTQDVSTTALPSKILYARDGSTVYEDHYSGTNTTTTTTKIYTSKGCLTLANVWNMEYKNEANTYNEFKTKSSETVREKVEKDDNIMKILRKRGRTAKRIGVRADALHDEYYLLEDMLGDNEKVSHMLDIFKYYVEIARGTDKSKLSISMADIINTSLFDLSNATDTNSTVKVLMYTSLNITDEDKQMLYTAVEKMTSGYADDDANTQRKKYITSVILNRALLSKFPDNVSGVLKQSGQFVNFAPSDLSTEITISDSTKSAVDSVVQGGDCSNYSILFNTPEVATSLGWDTKYKKTVEDSDKAYTYYTSDEFETELKKYEVCVSAGTTMASDTAQKIVAWAEAQVGKTEFYNSCHGASQVSKNYCAAFVKCAYYEAGLGYCSGNAKDIPHPNEMKFNSDGTVDYSDIPVGAVIVSKGVPVNGVDYGHVCLYVGNGYVIEAGGSTVQKKPIEESFGGRGHNCAPFVGWGFATDNQEEAYQKLVVKVGGGVGGNYAQGWTKLDGCGSWGSSSGTGIQGIFTAGEKSFKVYCQGAGPWQSTPLNEPSGNIRDAGCGITSVSIVLTGLGVDITPDVFKNQHSAGDGYVEQHLKEHGAQYKRLSNMSQIVEELRKGNPIIYHVNGGRVGEKTYKGHYCTLLGINENGEIFLGDPGSTHNCGYFPQSKFSGLTSAYAVWK